MNTFDQTTADNFGYAWFSHVDNHTYTAWVEQEDDGYRGTLRVQRNSDDEIILETEVGIAYAARFGPDTSDVYLWQNIALAAIDKDIEQAGSTNQ